MDSLLLSDKEQNNQGDRAMETVNEKNNVAPQENDDGNILEIHETNDSANNAKYNKYLFVTEEKVTMLNPLIIHTASPFKDLFPIREKDLKNIEESMKNNGFNSGLPITLWAGHDLTVIDGHTRLAAAQKLLFARIPVILKKFKDEAEALKYAIEMQTNRRNLTDAELINCINELDKRKCVGRPKKTPSDEGISGGSAENTGKLLGISRAKVERIRAINDHASDEIKEAVKSGEMTVNMAYNKTMDARRQEENRSESERRMDMHFAVKKGVPKVAKGFMDRLMEKNPGILFSGAEARILYQELCKELMSIVNLATVLDEQLKQD